MNDHKTSSRYILAFGLTTVQKFQKLKILIQGQTGLGAEIAKNILLLSPSNLTLMDNNMVELRDLGSNCFLTESHIGNKTRAQGSQEGLQKIKSNTQIEIAGESQLSPDYLKNFDLVIFSNYYNKNKLIEYNEFCRNQKTPIGFIFCGVMGLYVFNFVDYGKSFKIYDKDGEESRPFLINNITKANPGCVSIHKEKKHNLQTGDYVRIYDAQGMIEVNGTDTRPIRVIDDYSFTIEDTSEFSNYIKGGFVELAKVPFKITFNSLQQSFESPQKSDQDLFEGLMAILDFYQQNQSLPNTKQQKQSLIGENCNERYSNLIRYCDLQISPLCTFLGATVSLEGIKFTGKYLPLHDFFQLEFFNCLPENQIQEQNVQKSRYQDQIQIFGQQIQDKLSQFNVLLCGAGYMGCEYLKQLAMMGISTGKDRQITVLDSSSVKLQDNHYFLTKSFLNKLKSEAARQKVQEINKDVNIELVNVKLSDQNKDIVQDKISQTDLIINPNVKLQSISLVNKQSIFYEKPVINTRVKQLTCSSVVVLPHKTQSLLEQTRVLSIEETQKIDDESNENFPFLAEHNVYWANQLFESIFNGFAKEIQSFMNIKGLNKDDQFKNIKYKILHCIFVEEIKLSFANIIILTLELYQILFINRIIKLQEQYPSDYQQNDQLFWSGYKQFPQPLTLELTDGYFINFIISTANLFCHMFKIQQNSNKGDTIYILKQNIDNIEQQVYLWNLQTEMTEKHVENIVLKISQNQQLKINIFGIEDEESQKLLYLEFLTASANLKCRCYNIMEIALHKVEKIAFHMIRNAFVLFPLISPYSCMNLYKLCQSNPKEKFKNTEINMTEDIFIIEVPKDAEQLDKDKSIWDVIEFQQDQTFEQILKYMQNTQKIEVTRIELEQFKLISLQNNINLLKSNTEFMSQNPAQVYQTLNKNQNHKQKLQLLIQGNDSEGVVNTYFATYSTQ